MGDRIGESIGLLHLGQIAQHDGDDDRALGYLEEALRIARDIEYREVEGECELLIGAIALDGGDLETANERLARSMATCRDAADKRGEANALRWLGRADLAAGNLASARDRLAEAFEAFRNADMWEELLGCCDDCAILALQLGRGGTAAGLALTSDAARERLSLPRAPRAQARWETQSGVLAEAGPAEVWEIDAAIRAVRELQVPAKLPPGEAIVKPLALPRDVEP